MIEFINVTKRFGSKTVLNGLDISIPRGKVSFLLGKSGEGKSVTIKHILGLLKPTSGTVLVDNQDIQKFDSQQFRAYRRSFGMLFQHAALFDSMTVEQNIKFPIVEQRKSSLSEIEERYQRVVFQIKLEGLGKKYPDELSTGEKKRVGLARALITKPKILLYDEPTTGMDPLVSQMIDDLIVKINKEEKELTTVVISHDIKAALDTADYLVMLYKGKAIFTGSSQDFRETDNPIIRQFFSGKIEGPMEFV